MILKDYFFLKFNLARDVDSFEVSKISQGFFIDCRIDFDNGGSFVPFLSAEIKTQNLEF